MNKRCSSTIVGRALAFILFGMIVISLIAVSMFFTNDYVAQADSIETVDVNEYVDSDCFIDDQSQTIQTFANVVKTRNSDVNNIELAQIIPLEYLEFKEDNFSYGYNGKEYGFYVKHRIVGNNAFGHAKIIDVVIIDFTYSVNDTVISTKAEMIVCESFIYTVENGNDVWNRIVGDRIATDKTDNAKIEARKTYYIAQPSYITYIQNENERNADDAYYDKKNDNGAIIYQSRINYQGIKIVDDGVTSDEIDMIISGVLSIIEGRLLDYIAGKIPFVSEAVFIGSLAYDIANYAVSINDAISAREVSIPSNRESDIFQEQSKTTQRNNDSLASYSRLSVIRPTDNVLLSTNNNGFVSCAVLLNDSNSSTRVNQLFEYELKSSDFGDATSNLLSEHIDEQTGEVMPYFSSIQKTLFKDASQSAVKSDGGFSYYMLNDGEQKIVFSPEHSGEYDVIIGNDSVEAYINGQRILNGEKVYIDKKINNIVLKSMKKVYGSGKFSISNFENKTIDIDSNNDYYARFIPGFSGVYQVGGNDCKVTVFDSYKRIVGTANNTIALPFAKNKEYYVLFQNITTRKVTSTMSIVNQNVEELEVDNTLSINCSTGINQIVKINVLQDGQYDLKVVGADGTNLSSFNLFSTESGENIVFSNMIIGENTSGKYCVYRTVNIESGEYYLCLNTARALNLSIECYKYVTQFKWFIDGKEYKSGDCITRGVSHSLELKDSTGNTITNRELGIGIDYQSVTRFGKDGNKYTLYIDKTAALFKDKESVNAHLEIQLYGGNERGIYLCVISDISQIDIKKRSYDLDGNVGFDILTPFIESGQSVKIYINYRLDYDEDDDSDEDGDWIRTLNADDKKVLNKTLYIESYNRFSIYEIAVNNIISSDAANIDIVIDRIVIRIGSAEETIFNDYFYPGYKNVFSTNIVTSGVHFESGNGVDKPFVIANEAQYNQIEWTIHDGKITSNFIIESTVNFNRDIKAKLFDCVFNGTLEGRSEDNVVTIESNTTLPNGDIALFRSNSGIIKNLKIAHFSSASVGNAGNSFGGLVIENNGVIMNCTVSGGYNQSNSIYGTYVGGIAAINNRLIFDCKYAGILEGGKYIGGIAGYSTGYITRCEMSGYINYAQRFTDTDYIGGIVGYGTNGQVIDSTFNGNISINVRDFENRTYQPYVAGIVGLSNNVKLSNNVSQGTFNLSNLNTDVSWTKWFKKYHHNQKGHFDEIANVA